MPAPYRFPIWNQLSKVFDLRVYFLLKEKNWRNWPKPEKVGWRYIYLSLWYIKINEFEFIPQINGVKKVLDNSDVIILGSWESPFYLSLVIFARAKKIPIVQIYESTLNSHKYKKGMIAAIRKYVLSKASLIVTFGKDSSEAVLAMGLHKNVILELYNPVDVKWFHLKSRELEVSGETGHSFIFVGQLIERKNVRSLIQAFSIIRNSKDKLIIVGEGKLKVELLRLVVEEQVEQHVIFMGQLNQEELVSIYNLANSLILPSSNEVWGLVVNEALASGLHVIVSRYCGVTKFIEAMNGVFVCDTDVSSIAKEMIKSRDNWSGKIKNPQILDFTPERFAEQLANRLKTL